MKFNLESGHCCFFLFFVWVVGTGVDSGADRGCNAQPASQTFFHVHVYPGSGPVHPHSTFHRRSRCRRWGNSQTAHDFQHHQAPQWWLHHPPVWSHTPNLLLHVAWPQWYAHWIPTSELLTYSTEELWGHSLFYFLQCRKQFCRKQFCGNCAIFLCRWSLRFMTSSLRGAHQWRFTCL